MRKGRNFPQWKVDFLMHSDNEKLESTASERECSPVALPWGCCSNAALSSQGCSLFSIPSTTGPGASLFHTDAYLFAGTPGQIPYFSALPFWQTPQKIIWYLMSNSSPSTLSLACFVITSLFSGPQRFSPLGIQILVKHFPQSPRVYLCKYSKSNCMIYVNTVGGTDEDLRDLKLEAAAKHLLDSRHKETGR